jgi:hemoglobin-like flavoprotein
MGGAPSTLGSHLKEERVEWSIPSWCYGPDKCTLTPEMVALVQQSWQDVMSDTANVAYVAARAKDPTITPLTYFYNHFYENLFEWLPEVRPMFKHGIRHQGKMLANVIKYIVANLANDETEFKANLTLLAKVHNGRGITANHYSIMGMTLVHTIRVCLGPGFTEDLRVAWTVVYSRMMLVIIPIVVSGDRVEDDYVEAVTIGHQAPPEKQTKHRFWAWRDPNDEDESKCPVSNQSGDARSCPASTIQPKRATNSSKSGL